MPYINSKGSPSARVWIILDKPFSTDIPPSGRGYVCSGGMGYAFQKMFEEAGFAVSDLYFTCRRPDSDNPMSVTSMDSHLASYQPPLILVVGEAAGHFLEELELRKGQDTYITQLNKYVGSLLKCKDLKYPHWMMPLLSVEKMMQDWQERNVTTYIDLQKIRDEFIWWRTHGTVQPLRDRTLIYHDMDDDELLTRLDGLRVYNRLSEDIESIYPKKGSKFYQKHPGYPITLGIAPSPDWGMSFNIFRNTPAASREVWRKLDEINSSVEIIGQNFFIFDSQFISALGFRLNMRKFHDTLIRAHILWPELPKKLQFLTRQYTREPYYKDEGKQWSLKDMNGLRRYNCLDVCCTYEVFEGQEADFQQRPHLIGGAVA